MKETESFESWAIVELMGHSRIAGLVSEKSFGGKTMLRVDVPETEKDEAYTRFWMMMKIFLTCNSITLPSEDKQETE